MKPVPLAPGLTHAPCADTRSRQDNAHRGSPGHDPRYGSRRLVTRNTRIVLSLVGAFAFMLCASFAAVPAPPPPGATGLRVWVTGISGGNASLRRLMSPRPRIAFRRNQCIGDVGHSGSC